VHPYRKRIEGQPFHQQRNKIYQVVKLFSRKHHSMMLSHINNLRFNSNGNSLLIAFASHDCKIEGQPFNEEKFKENTLVVFQHHLLFDPIIIIATLPDSSFRFLRNISIIINHFTHHEEVQKSYLELMIQYKSIIDLSKISHKNKTNLRFITSFNTHVPSQPS
jgi:hypothetical protein